jgi:hypothetical protein
LMSCCNAAALPYGRMVMSPKGAGITLMVPVLMMLLLLQLLLLLPPPGRGGDGQLQMVCS